MNDHSQTEKKSADGETSQESKRKQGSYKHPLPDEHGRDESGQKESRGGRDIHFLESTKRHVRMITEGKQVSKVHSQTEGCRRENKSRWQKKLRKVMSTDLKSTE
jgi:hypothetical protein